ncbi:TPA: LapB repeat-containing protein, partial [Listeria monocytogenes]|nr:LapB repeat-containing protein [Listeria monocytogenes]
TDDGTAVKSDFDQVVKLDVPGEYTVTLNAENAAGLKATPVTVKVTVHEKPVITSDSQISYKKETTKSVDEFLKEIHGSVTGNAVLTSDFDKVVDLNTPGEYTVTLNAINDRGQKADPVTVVVTVTTSDSGHVNPVPPTPEVKPTPQEETDQTIIPEAQSETREDPVKEDQAKAGQAKSEEKADKTSLTMKENKVEKSEKTNQPKTKALPQTGDTNKTALPIAGVMLSLAALLIFRKSKS